MKKLTAMIVIFAIPALVLAGPRKMMREKPASGMRMETCAELNLTAEQQQKIDALRLAHQKEMIPLQADIRLAKLELDELVRAGDTSKKLDAAIKKVNDLKSKRFEKQVKHRMDVANILTAEQKAIWQKNCRMGDMGQGSGKRGCERGMKEGHCKSPKL